MATKPIKKHSGNNLKDGNETVDRITAVAERLVAILFARDREVLDREQKLREKALDVVQKIFEKQPNDELLGMINAFVKEASNGLSKVIDLKKLEAMTPKDLPRKGAAAASRAT